MFYRHTLHLSGNFNYTRQLQLFKFNKLVCPQKGINIILGTIYSGLQINSIQHIVWFWVLICETDLFVGEP